MLEWTNHSWWDSLMRKWYVNRGIRKVMKFSPKEMHSVCIKQILNEDTNYYGDMHLFGSPTLYTRVNLNSGSITLVTLNCNQQSRSCIFFFLTITWRYDTSIIHTNAKLSTNSSRQHTHLSNDVWTESYSLC